MDTKPLIVIIGPTASGKTELAIKIAERFEGEIMCADSRTVYEGMDIGTAKPTEAERKRAVHWGLDLVRPDETYTAAMFKEYATKKIEEIRNRGHVPILVGGSGLYVDSVVFDYEFGDKADPVLRKKLESLTVEELQDYCRRAGIVLPENDKNKRYLVRAIEREGTQPKRRQKPVDNAHIFGIYVDREELRGRIERRAEGIFSAGVVREAEALSEKYGWDHESMKGNIYPICKRYLEGDISIDEAREKFIVQDWRLAKRQMTWFRRTSHTTWGDRGKIEHRINSLLASE